MIQIKRAYDKRSRSDGFRVLVDRLWPRGVTKQKAGIDLWMKDLAPSAELRDWFGHDPERWAEFRRRYQAELREHGKEGMKLLRQKAKEGTVTLVYGAKDEQHNNAVVLQQLLSRGRSRTGAKSLGKHSGI